MKTLFISFVMACVSAVVAAPAAVSLSPILMYVTDRASADAAAARVEKLMAVQGMPQLHADPYDLFLLRSTKCFGSVDLQRVMRPFMPEPTAEEKASIQPTITQLEQMWQAIADLSATLRGVQDKATADAAAEVLAGFVPYMESCTEKFSNLSPVTPEETLRALRVEYVAGKRLHAAQFLQAWGELAFRSPDYYESEALVEALLGVRDVFENMGMQVDPEAIPSVVLVTRKMHPLMQQWIDTMATVQDKPTADAAAAQVRQIREQMAGLALQFGLSRSHEEDFFLYSPRLEILAHVMDRVSHYLLDELSPACYGSEQLREALEHED